MTAHPTASCKFALVLASAHVSPANTIQSHVYIFLNITPSLSTSFLYLLIYLLTFFHFLGVLLSWNQAQHCIVYSLALLPSWSTFPSHSTHLISQSSLTSHINSVQIIIQGYAAQSNQHWRTIVNFLVTQVHKLYKITFFICPLALKTEGYSIVFEIIIIFSPSLFYLQSLPYIPPFFFSKSRPLFLLIVVTYTCIVSMYICNIYIPTYTNITCSACIRLII